MYSFYGSSGLTTHLLLSATDESADDAPEPASDLRRALEAIEPGRTCVCGCTLRLEPCEGEED